MRIAKFIAIGAVVCVAACGGGGGGSQPSVPLRFLYASAYTENGGVFSGAIYAFSVDSTGAITAVAGSPFAPTTNGAPIAISRDSKFLYSVDSATGKLSAFVIGSDGSLTDVPGAPFATPQTPVRLVAHPTSDFLYASADSGNVMVFAIDPTTGVVSLTSSFNTVDSVINDIAMTSDGQYFYQASLLPSQISGLLTNASTGALLSAVPGSPLKTYFSPLAIAIHPTGKFLYIADEDYPLGAVYASSIDAASGSLTSLSAGPSLGRGAALHVAIDASGKFLLVDWESGNTPANCLAVLSIDLTTGALTEVPGSPFGQVCGVLAADPSKPYIYVGAPSDQPSPGGEGVFVCSIDETTGALSVIGSTSLSGLHVSSIALTH
jgi:6-phosphogluconolactonase (cycloisomerase 2 family)